LVTQAIYKLRKSIEEFHQFEGVPEQPILVSTPLFRACHKMSRCSFHGTADFGILANMVTKKISSIGTSEPIFSVRLLQRFSTERLG
jgi:hypothetical protein